MNIVDGKLADATAKTIHRVRIRDTGDDVGCREDLSVLRAMECIGRRGIPVGCRNGGCGVCKVEVLSGPYRVGRMSRDAVSAEEEASGIVLACRLYALGDLEIGVIGRFRRCLTRHLPGAALPQS